VTPVRKLILVLMSGWCAVLTLLLGCLFVVILSYGFLFWRFSVHMKSDGYSLPKGTIRQKLSSLSVARRAAKAWFAEREHWVILAFAFVIMSWGLALSASSGEGLDFSRSGALITLPALLSAFVGSLHAEGLLRARRVLRVDGGRDTVETNQRAEGLSRVWIAIIITGGTLIWGYGDLAFPGVSRLFCPQGKHLISLRCSALQPPPPPSITVLVQPDSQETVKLFDLSKSARQRDGDIHVEGGWMFETHH
jgi:hypothetical protein